jgi:prophage regulatory protein
MSQRNFRIISRKQLRDYVPYSTVHIWRLEQQGRFPKRITFGPRRVGWDLDEVLAWVEARKSQRDR